MFHHFHDHKTHLKAQGSIDKDDFYKMIKFIGRNNILNCDVFFDKLKNKNLKKNEVCLTFDDAIKSQFDIALPVLEDLKIKSFFFSQTSTFDKNQNNIEHLRYFRTNYFNKIDDYYNLFFKILDKNLDTFFLKNNDFINDKKTTSPHYSLEDIKFRLVRDSFLSKADFDEVNFLMYKEKKFNYKNFSKILYFTKNDLKKVETLGHFIGLHSHNHPTMLENLSYKEQRNEYETNLSSLSKILNKSKNSIKCMAHPSGSYNNFTLKILKEIGIELGFKHSKAIETKRGMKKINNSNLEVARENHSKIYKMMNL